MIPLRDDVPSRTVPFVNYGLIALNGVFFLGELGLGPRVNDLFASAAVIPVLYAGPGGGFGPVDAIASFLDPGLSARVFLSMFLHGGWLHIIGNMLYLWIFGDNVEDRVGHFRYVLFYLLCGWTATYAHIWSDPTSRLPSIGASGAIAGVLGAYLTLYPKAQVITILPLGIFFPVVRLPAIFFLGFWFLQQFLMGFGSSAQGGVAWWAHIGGFASGVLLVQLFKKPDRRPPRRDVWWEDHPYSRVRRGTF
jgi:rhomboid family protein